MHYICINIFLPTAAPAGNEVTGCLTFIAPKGEFVNSVRSVLTLACLSAVFAGECFADEGSAVRLEPKGYTSIEFGQIVEGYDKNAGDIENVFIEKILTGFGLEAILGPRTKLTTVIEMKMFNEFPRLVRLGATRRLYFYPYLTQAEICHEIISSETWGLRAGGGYFPFKYNSDVRNLGEYLFRSTAYPQTLTTEFDYNFARLAGAYLKGTMAWGGMNAGKAGLDLLATTNTEWMAVHDLNLSLLGTFSYGKFFTMGLGAGFCSIISVDSSATSPRNSATWYLAVDDTTLSAGGRDTLNYTFAGTKLMARYSVDFRELLHRVRPDFCDFFGEQDLRFYGEAALLGVKNYPTALNSPVWYMSRLERIPVMFGFNWPTNPLVAYTAAVIPELFSCYFPEEELDRKEKTALLVTGAAGLAAGAGTWYLEKKLARKLRLDVLSVEAEWWGNRYPNNLEGVVIDGLPIPFPAGTPSIDSMKYKGDNWKWSIYGQKTFAGHYRVTFQAASDHMRTFALDWNRQDWEESLRSPKKWCWLIKFGVLF